MRSAQRPRRFRPPALRWAVAAAVLLTSGGMITAATLGYWPQLLSIAGVGDSESSSWATKKRTPRHEHKVAAPAVANPVPAPAPAATEPIAVPPPPPALEPPPAVVHAPARHAGRPRSSTLSDESELLGKAVVHLRQQGDAAAALDDVDHYLARFPRGTLKREATVVRIDAMLMMKQDRGALPLLKQLDLQAHGRDQELRVIRGELSARESCGAAVADFDRVLSETPPRDLVERALYGRAGCRLRQGDSDGAADDLDQYLRKFPHGRFAAEARRIRAAK
jgi:TolA-binding protein